MLGPGAFEYPAPKCDPNDKEMGLYPVDFLLEAIIEAGIQWFIDTPEAPNLVFGHLKQGMLANKYGQAKIDEIAEFIKKYEITVVQHFSLAHTKLPSMSIQLMAAEEQTDRAGLADFERQVDIINADNEVVGRSEVGYTSVSDNVHIGIHTEDTPDLAKYLYYLLIYILNVFKPEFQKIGVHLGTFSATDLSRLNDYLPENIYSRFVNFQVWTVASYDRGAVPIIENILGLSIGPEGTIEVDENGEIPPPSENVEVETGITICDIKQSDGGG